MTDETKGFGINWGLGAIPDAWRRKLGNCKWFDGQMYQLQGLAFSREQADYMVVIATNGQQIRVVERKTAGGNVWGIYIY